jgi:hydroxyacylglutathione hydrolase
VIFAEHHIPGTINIPLNRSFTTWAGWLLSPDRDIHLIASDDTTRSVEQAVRDLAMIGLDRVAGYFPLSVLDDWSGRGRELDAARQMSPEQVASLLRAGRAHVVDVRGASEWEEGHMPDASHIPLGYLTERANELPRDRALVMTCQGGGRSAIGASLLRRMGFEDVINLTGGYSAWEREGHAVVK